MLPKRAQADRQFRVGKIDGVVVRPLRKFLDERGWLAELFRQDELGREFHPVMAYIASNEPGQTRGPHEHTEQSDMFCFIGPSNFELRMWDNRADSETYNNVMTIFVGEDNPQAVVVPCGVVHAYRNIGSRQGIVINCPNRLYKGTDRLQEVDEIRYEEDSDTIFKMDHRRWTMDD